MERFDGLSPVTAQKLYLGYKYDCHQRHSPMNDLMSHFADSDSLSIVKYHSSSPRIPLPSDILLEKSVRMTASKKSTIHFLQELRMQNQLCHTGYNRSP